MAIVGFAIAGGLAGIISQWRAAEAARQRADQYFQNALDIVEQANYGVALVARDIQILEEEAAPLFLRSISQINQLLGEQPDNIKLRDIGAEAYRGLGNLCRRASKLTEAEAAYLAGLEFVQKPEYEAFPPLRRCEARLLGDLSQLYLKTQPVKSMPILEKAADIYAQLIREGPSDSDLRMELGMVLGQLANHHRDGGRHQQAREAFAKALEIQRELVGEYPRKPEYRFNFGSTYFNLGQFESPNAGGEEKAEQAYQQAREILEELAREYPLIPRYRHSLAKNQGALALVYRNRGRRKRQLLPCVWPCPSKRTWLARIPRLPTTPSTSASPMVRWRD